MMILVFWFASQGLVFVFRTQALGDWPQVDPSSATDIGKIHGASGHCCLYYTFKEAVSLGGLYGFAKNAVCILYRTL